MKYPWFDEVEADSNLEQGDILINCKVLIPETEHYQSILKNIDSEKPINFIQITGIVLSQSCDIQNNKIDSIIICPIWPLSALIGQDDYFKSTKGREDLRQGKIPSYHLLNKLKIENNEEDFYFVDFRHIYSIPKSFILDLLRNQKRKRLLPPYREHLSQAFARYFMRVGLPTDISVEELKKYSIP